MDLSDEQQNFDDDAQYSSDPEDMQNRDSVISTGRNSRAFRDSLPAKSNVVPPSIISEDQDTNQIEENKQNSRNNQLQQEKEIKQHQQEAAQLQSNGDGYNEHNQSKQVHQPQLIGGRVEYIVSQSITVELNQQEVMREEAQKQESKKSQNNDIEVQEQQNPNIRQQEEEQEVSQQQQHEQPQQHNSGKGQQQQQENHQNQKYQQNFANNEQNTENFQQHEIEEDTITAQILVQQSQISDIGIVGEKQYQEQDKNQNNYHFQQQNKDAQIQQQVFQENANVQDNYNQNRQEQQRVQQIGQQDPKGEQEEEKQRSVQNNVQIAQNQINNEKEAQNTQINQRKSYNEQSSDVPIGNVEDTQESHISYLIDKANQISEIQQLRASQDYRQETRPDQSQKEEPNEDQYDDSQTNRATDNDLAQQEKKQLEDIQAEMTEQTSQKQTWEKVQSQREIQMNRNYDQIEVQARKEEIFSQGGQPDMFKQDKKINAQDQPSNYDVRGTQGSQQERQMFDEGQVAQKIMKSQPGQDQPLGQEREQQANQQANKRQSTSQKDLKDSQNIQEYNQQIEKQNQQTGLQARQQLTNFQRQNSEDKPHQAQYIREQPQIESNVPKNQHQFEVAQDTGPEMTIENLRVQQIPTKQQQDMIEVTDDKLQYIDQKIAEDNKLLQKQMVQNIDQIQKSQEEKQIQDNIKDIKQDNDAIEQSNQITDQQNGHKQEQHLYASGFKKQEQNEESIKSPIRKLGQLKLQTVESQKFMSSGYKQEDSQVIPSPLAHRKNEQEKLFTGTSNYSQANKIKVIEYEKQQSREQDSQFSERVMGNSSSELRPAPKRQQSAKGAGGQTCKCIIM